MVGVKIILLCLLMAVPGASSAAAEVKVAVSGRTVVLDSSGKFEAAIYTKQADSPEQNGCSGSRNPCSLVTDLRIFIKRDEVFVPRSVFSDLSDLRSANVIERGAHYLLVFSGGDGAESYIVKIYISRAVEQRVMISPLTSSVLQRTQYFSDVLD